MKYQETIAFLCFLGAGEGEGGLRRPKSYWRPDVYSLCKLYCQRALSPVKWLPAWVANTSGSQQLGTIFSWKNNLCGKGA